ncbi:hypothetical protein GOP47_0027928, partial [Adiantum capillus-veneris]
ERLVEMKPAYGARLHGELVSLLSTTTSTRKSRRTEEEAIPHLDVLWHYDCVVSSHSPRPAKLHADPAAASPRSPFHASGLLSPPSSEPSSSHSPLSPCSPATGSIDAVTPCSLSSPGEIGVTSAAPHLTSEQQHAILQRVFSTLDADGDGYVSIEELSATFNKLGIPKLPDTIQAVVASSLGNSINSALINEEEFFRLYVSTCRSRDVLCSEVAAQSSADETDGEEDQDLRAVFQLFDLDGNGFISPRELQYVLCSLGFTQARKLDACIDMIARADENGDGYVDISEFKKLLGFACPKRNFSC